jgi:hypothetical protein
MSGENKIKQSMCLPEYQKNTHVIESDINVNFEDLLEMTPDEFRQWVIKMRKVILDAWDTHGCPPRTGKNLDEIIDGFNKLASYPVHEFEYKDELSNLDINDVIINKSRMGVEVDQWFSNMFKTRINYSEKDNGYSIYDLVASDDYLDRVVRGSMRHMRRDSFYSHALSAIRNSKKYSIVDVNNGNEWMEVYFSNPTIFKDHDFFLEQVEVRSGPNSGYFQLDQSEILVLDRDQLLYWKDKLNYRHHSTFDINNLPDNKIYSIRIYKKGNKVFPDAFKAFRIGYIQPAVNFPPLTAKYLYERYTDHCKANNKLVIYDPSCGWGGRILGAMSVNDDRIVHYIGTDPNRDNFPKEGHPQGKYGSLADFYNQNTYRGNSFFSTTNTYEVFMHGSETIGDTEGFSKYKGMVDLVFTSPPYFNREAYSEDETQSYKKFSSYESWRDGFLQPTLLTCVEVLKSDRYLLWNIADLLVRGEYLPLEEDSKKILESLGMQYKYTLKMAMESMPGQNRLDENGIPKCKNYCKVNGKMMKYEPIFVFYKP